MDRIRWQMNQIGPAHGWRPVPGRRLESLAQDVRHASRMLRKAPRLDGGHTRHARARHGYEHHDL